MAKEEEKIKIELTFKQFETFVDRCDTFKEANEIVKHEWEIWYSDEHGEHTLGVNVNGKFYKNNGLDKKIVSEIKRQSKLV